MKKTTSIILLILSILSFQVKAVKVEGLGEAAGSGPGAREQALTEAMRDAIRQGIGVDLVSQTQITNFMLDYDRVTTAAFGYISSYKVLSQKVNKDGDYTVRISADVKEGSPAKNDLAALKTVISRKGSPRVLIEVEENIAGVKTRTPLAESVLKELAKEIGLQVISPKLLSRSRSRRGRRDALIGRENVSKARSQSVMSKCDIVISCVINGSFEEVEVYGMKSGEATISLDFEVSYPDTGAVLVQQALPTKAIMSSFTDPLQGTRDALVRLMKGKVSEECSAVSVYSKIIANWVTELDLGAKVELDFTKISKPMLDKVMKDLQENHTVTNVLLREFDGELYSLIEVETRLNTNKIVDIVRASTDSKYKLDKSSKYYLQFVPK